MKILSGQLRGKNFYMPFGIRPTQDLIRKAIFDIIGHDLSQKDLLDLYAGSGSVGFEAISHGARRVVFVEKDSKCADVIGENMKILGAGNLQSAPASVHLINNDAFVVIKQMFRTGDRFHFVFADPPYGHDLAKKTLKTLGAHDILSADSQIIIQHDRREILPAAEGRILRIEERKYGHHRLSFYKKSPDL